MSAGHVMPPVKFLRSASLPFSEPAFNCAAMKRRHRLSSGEQSKHLCSFGKKGHKPGNLNTPTGIAVTKTGKMHCVYICKETWSIVHHLTLVALTVYKLSTFTTNICFTTEWTFVLQLNLHTQKTPCYRLYFLKGMMTLQGDTFLI